MTRKRETFWNAASMETYADTTLRKKRDAVAYHDGEHTANDLENIWAGLSVEEKLFIEYLRLSNKRTVVALYENRLFTDLMAKGLLQTPPGVGTLFMQYLQTTYTVPIAVWKYLAQHPDRFFADNQQVASQRLIQLAEHFNDQIDALLNGSPPAADANDDQT